MIKKILDDFDLKPRWVLLCLDIFIVCAGYVFSVLVRFNFDLTFANRWLGYKQVGVYLLIYILSSLIFKPHIGVVQFTHKEDIFKVLKTVAFASIILALGNFYVKEFHPPRYVIPFSILIVSAFVNFSLISGYRFAIKEFYDSAASKFGKRRNVVIFGAGIAGRIVARIMRDKDSKYELKAFLDDNPKLHNSTVYGVKIIKPEEIFLENQGSEIEELVIAIQNLSQERRSSVIELCLKRNILIKEVPHHEKWVSGSLSDKQIKEIKIDDLLGRPPINLKSKNAIEAFRNKKMLVTGASGSIGSEISRQIVNCEVSEVLLIDIAESPLYDLHSDVSSLVSDVIVDFKICDITKEEVVREILSEFKPHVIFHAAAYKHVPAIERQPLEGIRVNIFGTKIVADLACEMGVEKFIMVSTDKAVNPTNIMGATKRVAEVYTQSLENASETRFITTRFGNVLGSNGSIVPLISRQIERGGPVTVTHPEITRFFMTIPEACSLVLEAGAMGAGGDIFVFDMGQPVKIIDLAHKMIKLAGMRPEQDIEIKIIGLRPGEKLYEEVLANAEGLKKTHHKKIMIARKAHHDLEMVKKLLDQISYSLLLRNEMEVVKLIKELVPEFISKESKFSLLDQSSTSD